MTKYSLLFFMTFCFTLTAFAEEEEILTPPQLKEALTPSYPKELQAQGITGQVTFELLIDEKGTVENITKIKGLHPVLDSLSLETAKQLEFIAGHINGEAVAVNLPYTFSFSLEEALSKLSNGVRFTGLLREKGSGDLLSDMPVYYIPTDKAIATTSLPREQFLRKLGEFDNQEYEEGVLVTTTDSNGNFSFRGVPVGPFTLKTSSMTHEQISANLEVLQDSLLQVSYYLKPNEGSEYEIIVTYRSEPDEVSQRSLASHELGSVAGASGDPLKALHSLPGVARSVDEIVIRGARPEDNRFFIDDLEVTRLFHDGDVRSVFNGYLLDEIKFYPSAYGVRYGNVIGGVIKADTKKSFKSGFSGVADINVIDMGFAVHGTINDKWSLTGSARISERFGFVKWYVTELFGDDGLIPTYSDYFARATYRPNERHFLTLSTLGSSDSLVVPGNNQREFETERFNQTSTQWDWKLNDRLILTSRLGHLYSNYWYNWGAYDNKTKKHSNYMQEELQIKVNEKLSLVAGLHGDLTHIDKYEKVRDYKTKEVTTKATKGWGYGTLSPWLEATITPTPKLEIITGIRYDYYRELNYNGSLFPCFLDSVRVKTDLSGDPSFRTAFRYKINDMHTLKGGFGNYNATPEPEGVAIDTMWGDSTLPTTKALHFTLGHEWQINDYLSLDLQGYYNERWAIPWVGFSDSTIIWTPDGKGRAYGLEVFLKHDRNNNFSGWLSYTLSRSEEKVNDSIYRITDYDQPHNLQVVGNWNLPKRWKLGSKLIVSSGNPTTPLLSVKDTVYHDTTFTNGTVEKVDTLNYFKPTWGKENSERLKPAFKLNLRVAKTFLTKNTTTEVYLDVENVLYPVYKTPEESEYEYATGKLDKFYMAPIPMLGVKVNF